MPVLRCRMRCSQPLLALSRRNSERVLRGCYQVRCGESVRWRTFRRRPEGVTGCFALPRGSFHQGFATRSCCPLCRRQRQARGSGQNWNATDAVTDPTLPWKRLIWAAAGSDYYVVHYERGGIDHSFHILVAKLAKNDAKPKVVWHANGHQLKDYTAFLDALRTEKLDDRLDYPH